MAVGEVPMVNVRLDTPLPQLVPKGDAVVSLSTQPDRDPLFILAYGGVEIGIRPINFALLVQFHEEDACHGSPSSVLPPGGEAVPTGLARAIALGWQVLQAAASRKDVEDTVDGLPVVSTGTAGTGGRRHEGPKESPFLV